MQTLLLTRRSSFQHYAANHLFRRGKLDHVIFESGRSVQPGGSTLGGWRAIASRAAREISAAPGKLHWKLLYLAIKKRLYGDQALHDSKILGQQQTRLDPAMPFTEVDDINLDARVGEVMHRLQPAIIYVFGTRLIRSHVFAGVSCPVVNMHWGWSPDFRGEGIVSALAERGPEALGVTVHLLTDAPDGGDILFRDRPQVEPGDNVYSIGLKLTKLGAARFADCHDIVARGEPLTGTAQQPSVGRFYSSAFLRSHPEYYCKAWSRLRAIA
jgi:hypothetical protein